MCYDAAMHPLDLVGKTFGFLTVLSRGISDKRGQSRWSCRCQCGTVVPAAGCQLVSGKKRSCGCFRRHGLPPIAPEQTFGRLTVVGRVENDKQGNPQWACKCSCGNTATVRSYQLYEKTRSCGCFRLERLREAIITHGQSCHGKQSREYRAWCSMKKRCTDQKSKDFKYYGGRGITVSPLWQSDFQAFFDHAGPCPPGMELDRINVNGNYEPGNVRWVTHLVQCANLRRNIRITYNGETRVLSEWARYYHVKPGRLHWYIVQRKMSLDAAIQRMRQIDHLLPENLS